MSEKWHVELIGCIPDNYYDVYAEDGGLVATHIPTKEKALLIAAAPELLDACIDANNLILRHTRYFNGTDYENARKLNVKLNKIIRTVTED